jgi:hypothetical protein
MLSLMVERAKRHVNGDALAAGEAVQRTFPHARSRASSCKAFFEPFGLVAWAEIRQPHGLKFSAAVAIPVYGVLIDGKDGEAGFVTNKGRLGNGFQQNVDSDGGGHVLWNRHVSAALVSKTSSAN